MALRGAKLTRSDHASSRHSGILFAFPGLLQRLLWDDVQKPNPIVPRMLAHLGRVFGNPLPPGVTVVAGKSKTLLGTASKGHFVLKAAANAAPIEDVPISVLAHVSINFVVKVSYSSPLILVSVRKQ